MKIPKFYGDEGFCFFGRVFNISNQMKEVKPYKRNFKGSLAVALDIKNS